MKAPLTGQRREVLASPWRERCGVTGKFRYPDEAAARFALKEIKKHRPPHRKERGYYECAWCGEWHLTKKKRGASW